jgi:ubiquinone/menaquinone biosynthesis C-methylase UbiE
MKITNTGVSLMTNEEEFTSKDADDWYANNKDDLKKKTVNDDKIYCAIKITGIEPKHIMEIGCSNGYRLKWLFKEFNASCFGLDLSQAAIKDGKKDGTEISLQVGVAKNLPFKNDSFDLVIFGFCLYVCDRKDLFKIISEADRVLKDMGHIVIEDFYPPFPFKNKNKHKKDSYCYKMDYTKLFTCNPAYTLRHRAVSSHQGLKDVSNPDERTSVVILQKDLNSAYPENPFKEQAEPIISGDGKKRRP